MDHEKSAEQFFYKNFRNRPNGFPIATIAYYGPDNETATKVAVGILNSKEEVIELKRWPVRAQDVRIDSEINKEILGFLKEQKVRRVAIAGRILGCPHEEGIDYPAGSTCSQCPYWAKIDRWTGEVRKD